MNKRNIKNMIFITLLFVVVALNAITSFGFSMADVKAEEVKRVAKNIELTRISSPLALNPVRSFDVNRNGDIVLGIYSSRLKAIYVYDSSMKFKYGYTMNIDGTFGVNWDGDKVALYLVRGSFALYLDENGNTVQGKNIAHSVDNSVYWQKGVYATERTVNGVMYELRNNFGLLNILTMQSYSQLVKRSSEGTTEILYDVSDVLLGYVIVTAFVFLFFIGMGVAIIRKVIKDVRSARLAKG